MIDVPPVKHGKQTRVIEVDLVIRHWKWNIKELQLNAQKNMDEIKVENKKTQQSLLEQMTYNLSELKAENKKMQDLLLKQKKTTASADERPSSSKRDFSKVKCYNCCVLGHTGFCTCSIYKGIREAYIELIIGGGSCILLSWHRMWHHAVPIITCQARRMFGQIACSELNQHPNSWNNSC